ncbi:MAG: hypothetical protein KJO40_12025 [Deltaproteobacteria bacterium]|nr:hypothetical protein [Deltaproteobacteria bacterium]NNK06429.1 hypothetical protein [Myxococcales bacterium]RZV53538.1 MAG: hypothetical protein EX268_09215 [Deltaproteobacteria bacterium]
MAKRWLIALFLVAPALVFAWPSASSAQQPKLDIKVFFGGSVTNYVSLLETGREQEIFGGWQVGFGARVRRRKAFVEILFSFNRWALALQEADASGNVLSLEAQVNSFELPLIMGYIPYKNPLFKLFLYAGYVNHFNTRIIATVGANAALGIEETTVRLKPKDVDFAIYQAIGRLGVNFDVAMFNFDFNYSISLNSATKTSYRTSYQQLQVNLAYLF